MTDVNDMKDAVRAIVNMDMSKAVAKVLAARAAKDKTPQTTACRCGQFRLAHSHPDCQDVK